jgi:hypothetical protein
MRSAVAITSRGASHVSPTGCFLNLVDGLREGSYKCEASSGVGVEAALQDGRTVPDVTWALLSHNTSVSGHIDVAGAAVMFREMLRSEVGRYNGYPDYSFACFFLASSSDSTI